MKRSLTAFLFSIVVLFSATQAQAGACAGPSPFGDVAQGDIFCSDAAWAKNANITLGCGIGVFCPHDPVTRGEMVLFLNRMAFATFPKNPFAESATLPPGDLDSTGLNSCTTTTLALSASDNAAFAHVHAVVSMQAGASATDVQMSVGHSVNGGAFAPDHTANQIVTVPAGQWGNASAIVSFVKVLPGTSNRWRIDLARAPGSTTTGELTGLRCQIKVLSHMDFVAP